MSTPRLLMIFKPIKVVKVRKYILQMVNTKGTWRKPVTQISTTVHPVRTKAFINAQRLQILYQLTCTDNVRSFFGLIFSTDILLGPLAHEAGGSDPGG